MNHRGTASGASKAPKGTISWDKARSGVWHAHLHRTPKPVREEILPPALPAGEFGILD